MYNCNSQSSLPIAHIWIRSESANYGAERYAQNVVHALKAYKKKALHVKIDYMIPKNKSLLLSALLYILWLFKRKKKVDLNIYTFPFIPLIFSQKRDILIFHHADVLRGSLKSRITELFGLVILWFMSRDQLIVTVSPFWTDFLSKKFGFKNIRTIYNSIDQALLDRLRIMPPPILKCIDSKPKIYLGNASPKKGWPLALEISRQVYPDADYWISGNTYKNIRNSQVKHFRGNDSDFFDFLETVDISIFYSQFLEGWNRTLVEAALLSRSYVLNYSDSGGSIDAAALLTNISLFRNSGELYDHLLRIKNSVNHEEVYTSSDMEVVLNILSPSVFYQRWSSIVDLYI
jgi:hypothetical protein